GSDVCSSDLLAKTDRLDAQVLAHFAAAVQPPVRPIPEAAAQELGALVSRRRQLWEMLTPERNRLRTAPPALQTQLREHIAWLQGRIKEVDRQLRQRIRASELWRAQDELLRSVPGVGPVGAATLFADLREL